MPVTDRRRCRAGRARRYPPRLPPSRSGREPPGVDNVWALRRIAAPDGGLIRVLAIVFVARFIPETKGVHLETVHRNLERVSAGAKQLA